MADRSHLAPVTVTDKRGRTTTVYRRPGQPVPASAPKLPAPDLLAPSVAAAPLRWEKKFSVPDWIAETIAASAPAAAEPMREGSALLSYEDAFAYLRAGLTIEWGAAMHAVVPDPTHWEQAEASRTLANHRADNRSVTAPSVAASVDLMREHGYSPEEVERMLRHGLSDRHLRGVLTTEQTATPFTKVNCLPAPYGDASDSGTMTRALTDGTLPISLVDEDTCSRETLKQLALFLADSKDADAAEARAAREEDPETVILLAKLIDRGGKKPVPPAWAWSALRRFGADDCQRFGAARLLKSTGQRRVMGEVIREARSLGMDDGRIQDLLDQGLPARGLLAVARGDTTAPVAEGWL